MTRLGWAILVLFVVVLGAFLSVTTFGTSDPPRQTLAPASGGTLLVPVRGVARSALTGSWGDAREGGLRGHQGTDIVAPARTPVIAAAPGTIEKLFDSERGGTTLYIRSPDRRWTYYYAHLARYAPGVAEGGVVRAGDTLGYVGDTGDAGAGNYHLHFGISRMAPSDGWWQGEAVDPYPLLASGRLPG